MSQKFECLTPYWRSYEGWVRSLSSFTESPLTLTANGNEKIIISSFCYLMWQETQHVISSFLLQCLGQVACSKVSYEEISELGFMKNWVIWVKAGDQRGQSLRKKKWSKVVHKMRWRGYLTGFAHSFLPSQRYNITYLYLCFSKVALLVASSLNFDFFILCFLSCSTFKKICSVYEWMDCPAFYVHGHVYALQVSFSCVL